jgi:SAM-dependent methyltransferase
MATVFDYAEYGNFKSSTQITGIARWKQLARKFGLPNRYIKFFRDIDRFGHVVEIGCGNGEFMRELRSAGFVSVSGVDCCPSYAANDIATGDATAYLQNLPDASCGAIVALDVLEHFEADEAMQWLVVAAQKLRADGRIVVRVPNMASPLAMAIQFGDLSHRTAYTEVSMTQAAFDAGLSCNAFAEPRSYPRSVASIAGLILWPLYSACTKAVLAAFGQRVRILTPSIVYVLRHATEQHMSN